MLPGGAKVLARSFVLLRVVGFQMVIVVRDIVGLRLRICFEEQIGVAGFPLAQIAHANTVHCGNLHENLIQRECLVCRIIDEVLQLGAKEWVQQVTNKSFGLAKRPGFVGIDKAIGNCCVPISEALQHCCFKCRIIGVAITGQAIAH